MPHSAWHWTDGVRGGLASVEAWWLPAECLLCHEPVPERETPSLVCACCRRRWHHLPPPLCDRCGEPFEAAPDPGPGPAPHVCAGLEWVPALTRVRSAVWLDGGAREAVHLLKYEGWWRVADDLAIAMRHLEPLGSGAVLVPVPLGARRARERGYNQAERLAAALARISGLPFRPALLARTRETPTQTKLTPEARRANVHHAFRVREPLPAGRPVLVDDVYTTGATLDAAAAALAGAGAPEVEGVTFARGTGPLPRA